jgi:DNA polymerase-3 subunit epsilon
VKIADAWFVPIDCETTGLEPTDRVIEIAAWHVDARMQRWGRFSTFVNPGTPLPCHIQALTGIVPRDVVKAPARADVDRALEMFVPEAATMVAHQAEFDCPMIANGVNRLPDLEQWLCTKRLAMHLIPEGVNHDYRLQTLRYYFGGADLDLGGLDPHRAESDVAALTFVLGHLLRLYEARVQIELADCQVQDLVAFARSPIIMERWPMGPAAAKGKPFSTIERGLLDWALKKADLGADMRYTIELELRRRRAA